MSGASTPETPRFPGDPRPIEIAPGATRRVDLNSYFEGATECAFTLWSSLDPEVATAKVVGDTLIVEGRAEGETGLFRRLLRLKLFCYETDGATFASGRDDDPGGPFDRPASGPFLQP